MFLFRRRIFSCFTYISLAVFIAVFFLFMRLDKSSSNVIFDGPELLQARQQEAAAPSLSITPMMVPNPDFQTPVFNYPQLVLLPRRFPFDCGRLVAGDEREMTRAWQYVASNRNNFTHRDDGVFHVLTQNCDSYRRNRNYPIKPASEMESNFPIAFNILMYQNVDQFERLLRVVYAPQNQYCIHVDKKAAPHILRSVLAIAECFDNVFVASTLEVVVYASYKRLQADINCMQDHVSRDTPWKYVINMAASELPIKTNLQLVQILTLFNGTNDIHEVFSTMNSKRFKQKYITHVEAHSGYVVNTNTLKEDAPHGLTVTKGNAYNVFSRAFVEFVLQDGMAQDLMEWSRDTYTPDEHYWATLNNLYSNPFLKTPGGFKGHPDEKPFFGRYIGWKKQPVRCKAGHYVHNICIFSVEDLPSITERIELIANKFDLDYDPVAYSCMEEWLNNNTRDHVTISANHERLYKKITLHNEKKR